MRKNYRYVVELYRDYEHGEDYAEKYHFETLDKAETFIGTSNAKRKCTKYCIYEQVAIWEKRVPKDEPVQIDEFKENLINILEKNS